MSSHRLPNFSSSPPIVDQPIDRDSSPVDSTLSESQSPKYIPDQLLVVKKDELGQRTTLLVPWEYQGSHEEGGHPYIAFKGI